MAMRFLLWIEFGKKVDIDDYLYPGCRSYRHAKNRQERSLSIRRVIKINQECVRHIKNLLIYKFMKKNLILKQNKSPKATLKSCTSIISSIGFNSTFSPFVNLKVFLNCFDFWALNFRVQIELILYSIAILFLQISNSRITAYSTHNAFNVISFQILLKIGPTLYFIIINQICY